MLITRDSIKSILLQWQNGHIQAKDVLEWAEVSIGSLGSAEFDDWEQNEEDSVAKEVLMTLESANMNLILSEDIKAYIEFLDTPLGSFEEGYEKWCHYVDNIDYPARQLKLKNDPFYAPFCITTA